MLSRLELRHIAKGKTSEWIFDLSRIQHQQYEPMMKAIEKYGQHSIRYLTFHKDVTQKQIRGNDDMYAQAHSAAKVVPRYFSRLVKMLGVLLPISRTIEELHLIGLDIDLEDMEKLGFIISK